VVNKASDGHYQQRFERVIDYIYQHLDQPLDLNRLADIACLSPYHWHRIYHSVYGETLAATVQRLRLHRAAGQLTMSPLAIGEIAKAAGYASSASFSRAFSSSYGITPAAYRRGGRHIPHQLAGYRLQTMESDSMYSVNQQQIESLTLVGVEHRGDYMGIGQAFEKLFGWLVSQPPAEKPPRCIGLYFDDPSQVPAAQLRSMAAAVLPCARREIAQQQGMSLYVVQSGEYAVLRHIGPYSDLHLAYQWLYGQWLPQSGRLPADAPVFEEYLNNPREVSPSELITDIYLPLLAA